MPDQLESMALIVVLYRIPGSKSQHVRGEVSLSVPNDKGTD